MDSVQWSVNCKDIALHSHQRAHDYYVLINDDALKVQCALALEAFEAENAGRLLSSHCAL